MKSKNLFLLLLSLFAFVYGASADRNEAKYNVLLTGASFASPGNGWFEIGCRELGALPINRAVGGEAIKHTANKMAVGTLFSLEELDRVDVFVIMHVHDVDVFNSSKLLGDYKDYTVPFDKSDYAAAYDYVIKRYISECYNLKDNPKSKYFGTKSGKPAIIILCTHWHDARVTYNTSIRKLAVKWGLPLIEFDKYIGFSKESPHPVSGEQPSLIYSQDTQTIDDVKYGWHPDRGEGKYIQQRMATIFAGAIRAVMPLK